MKLLRIGEFGSEIPCVAIDGSNDAFDARPVTSDFNPEFFSNNGLRELQTSINKGKLSRLPFNGQRIGASVQSPGKIVCIGLNYRNHAMESGMDEPAEPIIFMKASNTLIGPRDSVMIPRNSVKTDWEVELAVVINARTSYLDSPDESAQVIAGYAISNDVSEREFQLERGGQWDKGKSCATFNPLGPWLVTTDEVPDPQRLQMFLDVNGHRFQNENTSDMIFSVNYLIWYVSQFMVLEPGDIINTGTPAGVGLGLNPPRYLVSGDQMRVGIEGLGEQQLPVIATP